MDLYENLQVCSTSPSTSVENFFKAIGKPHLAIRPLYNLFKLVLISTIVHAKIFIFSQIIVFIGI